ncbi:hypothetical protein AC00_2315 [Escherichia coli 1-250-04_S3_C1]|uniref:Uncharacterized protein n=1 Tax=Escherichia coli 1-250-04_S3_C1 TaxID=1444135 RepID=A0AAN4NTS5_ECOLX|nr:hypothetical protein AC00_2315 [Escherichia coli 1-250-04_S3_C1]
MQLCSIGSQILTAKTMLTISASPLFQKILVIPFLPNKQMVGVEV